MKDQIDTLLERTRRFNSPYPDEKATNAQLAELAKVLEDTLHLIRKAVSGEEQ